MSESFIPFAKPSINQAAIDEVTACLKSGWITTGPRVKKFEEDLKQYLQTPYALTFTSATAGLQLAFTALNLQPGDEVITTPMTFIATLNTIVQAGGKPVLADVDIGTRNISIQAIEKKITSKTKAIVPVHFAGLPVDLDPLYELANLYQLRVIEDAAHAIGTYYKNRLIGSFGDTQVFSFHPNKNMTSGEGGCVSTRDENMAKKISLMRFHGIDRDAFNRYSKEGSQYYDVVEAGFKYNMMDIQAAIGIHQLADLEKFISHRTQLANRYLAAFNNWDAISLPTTPSYAHRHAWHQFTILINPEIAKMNRDEFMQKMKEKNIGTGLQFQAAHLFSYYQNQFGYRQGDFPIAEKIAENIVSLPLFYDLTFEDQDRVIGAMEEIFEKISCHSAT